jgi:predicted ATP-dependent serine protease
MGKYCSKHGSYKCTNCGGNHTARATKCPEHRQAVAIAKSDRQEWREREKLQEERSDSPESKDDTVSICSSIQSELDTTEKMIFNEKTIDDTEMEEGGLESQSISRAESSVQPSCE